MPPCFNRLLLFAVLPLITCACQCATPVSFDEGQEGAAGPLPEESTTTDETPTTTTGADLRGSLLQTGSQVKCLDADGDGYGVGPECLDVDCDDGDSTLGSSGSRSCFTGPAGSAGVGICQAGRQTCTAGVLSPCVGEVLPQTELCDGADNDCDGETDEEISRSCYDGPAGTSGVGTCAAGVQTCSHGQFGACEGQTKPETESCDGQDNDCDGATDENVSRACYDGPSGTEGVGICSVGVQLCQNGQYAACQGVTMPAFESCDGADNDCDGDTDENVERFTRDRSQQSQNVILRPVDVILVVDNSGSMTDEIVAVQNNINVNFANLLANSGIDYRVILLSKHGSASGSQSICIKSPLSGNGNCSTLSYCPVNSTRFFHYSTEIGSHDSLERIVNTYNAPDPCGLAPNGWSAWLRPGAAKVFIEITDDSPSTCTESSCTGADYWTADKFESRLFALSPTAFGSATNRGYLFHTIAGLKENVPVTAAWLPTQPLVTSTCTGNGGDVVNAGLAYQRLSTRTGGLRYPICQYQSFDAVFREVATGIIEKTVMACDFTLAQIPAGSSMDGVGLELSPGSGTTTTLTRVADASACTSNAFYVSGTAITLCPGACATWQNDTSSSLSVTFSCVP